MKTVCIEEIKKDLKETLNEERYNHTLGVLEMAVKLAEKYGADIKKAELAGLLHDCAKCMKTEDLLNYAKNNCSDLDEGETINYKTLHAPVGAKIVCEKYKIDDPEIISAIRWHTIGRVDMSLLDKIVFLADKIETKTRPVEYREPIAKILDEFEGEYGLNLALLKCFEETIKSLVIRKLYICKTTIDVYNWLLDITKSL